MIEGIITLASTASGKLYGRIVWQAQSNGTEKNTSTVTAQVQLHRQAGFTTTGTWKGSVTVGSTTESISYYGSIGSSWVTVKTLTATVNHSADGSGTCYIYSKVNGPGATSMEGVYVSGSETITLEKIARYASAMSMAAFTDEENPVVKYTNPAGSAVQTLEAALSADGTNATVAYRSISKTGERYTFSLAADERNALLSASANSKTLKVYALIRSTISDVENVDKVAATMTVVNAKPKLSPKIVDTNSATIALTGNSAILVALHSVASVTVNASGQKYATIKSIRVEHGTKVLSGDGTLNVTNDPIKITVTDSRGNTTTYNAGNTIIPYIDPTCVIGNAIPDGAGKLDLSVTGLVYDGSIGKTENAFTIQYRYKEGSGDYTAWTTFPSAVLSGNSYTAAAAVSGLNYQSAYTFQARVIDSLNTSGITSATKKFKAVPVFNWGENNFNFNAPVTLSGHQIKELAPPTEDNDAVNMAFLVGTLNAYSKKIIVVTQAGTDLNDYKEEGCYFFYSSPVTPSNVPSGSNGWLWVLSSAGPNGVTYTKQLWFRMGTPGSNDFQTFVRTTASSLSGWGEWTKYATAKDLPSLSITKLWENASPTSAFAAQTVSVDLSGYDGVMVTGKFQYNGADVRSTTGFIPVGQSGHIIVSNQDNANLRYRRFTVSKTGVQFETGINMSTSAESTNFAIPVAIYGIKGVS